MKDPRHKLKPGGFRCTRCAINTKTTSGVNVKYCPPGFWMSKAQHKQWDAASQEPPAVANEATNRLTREWIAEWKEKNPS